MKPPVLIADDARDPRTNAPLEPGDVDT